MGKFVNQVAEITNCVIKKFLKCKKIKGTPNVVEFENYSEDLKVIMITGILNLFNNISTVSNSNALKGYSRIILDCSRELICFLTSEILYDNVVIVQSKTLEANLFVIWTKCVVDRFIILVYLFHIIILLSSMFLL